MLLITQPRVGKSYNEILALQMTAREMGWEVIPAPYSWRLEEELIKSEDQGIAYGSQLFCEAIAQQMNWKLKLNSFDWLAKLPFEFLKRKVEFMTLGEAKQIQDRKFIKPADDKCFDARVYETFNPSDILEDNIPVLVSEVVEFIAEYRCFIKDGRALTSSCYILEGELAEPKNWYNFDLLKIYGFKDPINYINMMLTEVDSENAVIDIGIIKDQGIAVIESNPTWASGIYGCDPYLVLQSMQATVCKL
jgi:hypothetical protein